jgi:hypothetical protein
MKTSAWWLVVLVLSAGPSFAQKIYIDHDTDYDSSKLETFQWAKTEETGLEQADPLLHSRIVNGIEHYLTLGGVREVLDDPDVYVTYHTNTKEDVSFNTSSYGYGYPGGWGYGGYYGAHGYGYGGYGGMSTTTVSTYIRGTLIVDVWDAASKELVWRGMAANITVSDNPAKMTSRIDKALKKMIDKWQQIKAYETKDKEKAAKRAAKDAEKAAKAAAEG